MNRLSKTAAKGTLFQKPKSNRLLKAQKYRQKNPKPENVEAVKPTAHNTVTTLNMGDFDMLSRVTSKARATQMNLLSKVDSFKQLKLHSVVREGVFTRYLNNTESQPTAVQKVALKALLLDDKFSATLLAAETGSGKTLAYLGPVLSNLLHSREKTSEKSKPTNPTSDSPPTIEEGEIEKNSDIDMSTFTGKRRISNMVFVPTFELANQVYQTAKALTPELNISLFAGSSNHTEDFARDVYNGIDLAILTPAKLLKFMNNYEEAASFALDKCSNLIVDEADSLLNRSFEKETMQAIDQCNALRNLVFCTATIPHSFDRTLVSKYPELRRLVTPSIHRLPRHIDFKVVEVWHKPYMNNKKLALRQALYAIFHDNSEPNITKRVLVFVNRRSDVQGVADLLIENGFNATALDHPPAERAEIIRSFMEPTKINNKNDVNDETNKAFGDQRMKVLVATDVCARGVDFHSLRNVILYDMPFSAADLLHRAGRTGRLGKKGRVIMLVERKDGKHWLKGLEKVVKKGQALA